MKTDIKFLYAAFAVSLMSASCTEDNGNYDYTDIGTVTLEIEADHTVMYGERLQMEPKKLKFENTSEADYDWSWEIAPRVTNSVPQYREIADTKVLDIPEFQSEIGSYTLRLSAIHRSTGVRTMAYCDFKVDNGLSRVYLLLTRQPSGEFDLEAVTYPGGIARYHQYSLMNGQTIPDAERLFYLNPSSSRDERLYMALSEGCQALSPIDLTYQGDASALFFDTPKRVHVTYMYTDVMDGKDQFMVNDGGIYHTDNWQTPYKAKVRCVLPDGSNYSITGTGTIQNSSGRARYAWYDGLNGRFIEWNFGYGANYIQPLTTTSGVAQSAFDPQNIDKKFVTSICGKPDRMWVLFEDDGGDLWLYTFKDGAGVYYNVIIQPAEPPLKLDDTTAALFRRATAFCAVKSADKFYYAVDNNIWIYNAATHRTEAEPFYTSPDPAMRFSKINYETSYNPEVTFAGNSNGHGTFFRIRVDDLGRIADPTETFPEPVMSYDGFGEITDFVYKYKSNN